jgi:hypothetical protein
MILLTLLLSLTSLAADKPSTHGMLLFGKANTIYVSHLPMFHNPHDYQLIAHLNMPSEAIKAYKQSLAEHPEETIYTLVPESFVLPEMVAHPEPFKADLVRGHFERGGTEIVTQVTVSFGKIVHFRKFDPKAIKPAASTFLYFGSREEAFLAHYITARPDFDQVIEAKGSAPDVAWVIESEKENTSTLEMGEHVFKLNSGGAEMKRTLTRSLYTEFGDLAH